MEMSQVSPTNDGITALLSKLREIGLDKKDVVHHSSLRRASVLVLLVRKSATTDELCVLLTQRPMHLSSHPGEVCFPGGKQDPNDNGDDIVTALRETKEEIGLDAHDIRVLCRLRTIESLHHLCVTPIVGYLGSTTAETLLSTLEVSPMEVQAVFFAPLSLFQKPPLKQFTVKWSKESFIMRHYEHATSNQVFAITGLTAHIANQVANIVYVTEDPHVTIISYYNLETT
jgi:coenzyme A diphosphatase NUDT7